MRRALFAGVRLEGLKAFSSIMENYDFKVDIVTLKDSFIERKIEEFDPLNVKAILSWDKSSSLDRLYDLLSKNTYDVFLSVGFPYILPKRFFETDTIYINSHPHLLPGNVGTHVIKESFMRKEKIYGVTLHYMTEEVDGGEIIFQKTAILEPTNIDDIYSNLFSSVEPSVIKKGFSLLKEKNVF